MKPKKLFNALLISASILLFLPSCMKEIKDIDELKITDDWKPGMAVPLVHSVFSVSEILNQNDWDSLFQYEPDNFMLLVYQKKFVSDYASEFIDLQDQLFESSPLEYNVSGDSVKLTTAVSVEGTEIYDFNFGGDQEVVKMDLKQGNMNININTSFRKSGEVEVIIPNATRNGTPFRAIVPFEYQGSEPIQVDMNVNLKGYTVNLTGAGGYNKVPVTFKVTLYANNNYIRKTDNAEISLSLTDMDFSYIEGYLGYYEWNFKRDSLLLNIYDGSEAGKIYFADPKINIELFNTLGMPITVTSNSVRFSNDDHEVRYVQSSLIDDPIDINFPNTSQRGKQSYTHVLVNRDNSNLTDILSILPNHMFFDFDLELNKDKKVYDNFALDTSSVKMNVELELPLNGRTENWEVEQEEEFEMPELIDDVDKVIFNVIVDNGFPMEAQMQLYFVDSNDVLIDSLLTQSDYIFRSASVNSEGKVSKTTRTVTAVEVSRDRIDEIKNTQKIILNSRLSTTSIGQQNVKIYSDYTFDVKLSLLAKVKKDLNEDN